MDEVILMEYKHFFKLVTRYLQPGPTWTNEKFQDWLRDNSSSAIYKMADHLEMALPEPRVEYYRSNDYFEVQKRVTGHTGKIIEALGFYPVQVDNELLKALQIFSQATMFLGLIFDIVILLFMALSVLLIYSLLMISVESRAFEFGVIRMIGLNKAGIIYIILIQATMFVLPAVFCGFVSAIYNLG
jgi:hypothetical protein